MGGPVSLGSRPKELKLERKRDTGCKSSSGKQTQKGLADDQLKSMAKQNKGARGAARQADIFTDLGRTIGGMGRAMQGAVMGVVESLDALGAKLLGQGQPPRGAVAGARRR